MKKKVILFIVLTIMFVLPFKVSAITQSEIKEKKEITLKSVPPKNLDELEQLNEVFYEESNGLSLEDCNSSYTTCNVVKWNADEREVIASNVTIKYEYDADVKKVVDGILSKLPENGKTFHIEDVYAIKWVIDDSKHSEIDENSEGINPIKYSPEFNSFIGYNNFSFDPRMGDDIMYAHYAEGTFQFKYNGTIYGYGHMATRVDQVVYVDDNETDIIGALKTRLSKYFNIKDITKDEEFTIEEFFNDELNYQRDTYNQCVTDKNSVLAKEQEITDLENEKTTLQGELETLNAVAETDRDEEWNNTVFTKNERITAIEDELMVKKPEYETAKMNLANSCNMLDEYENADSYVEYWRGVFTDQDSEDALWNKYPKALPNVYVITLKDSDISSIPVFVIKDSSKIFNDDLGVKTKDAKSGITINNTTTSKTLPFDTLIQVSKLTSGNDYDKVVNALEKLINKDNIEMFDLKLFSNAINNYITKLDDGSFEVRIPLSDNFKDKTNLIAYYVDENNNIKEYNVKIEVVDDIKYAVFTTDHFSIYTLAEKPVESEPVFKLTYNFNGGTRQGEKEYIDESVGFGMDVTKEIFIDKFGVTPPEGMEIDAIEMNGTRVEFGDVYMLNKDTVFKYLWKEIPKEETKEEETTIEDKPEETVPVEKEEVPKTFDNIFAYIIILVISAIVFTGTIVIKKKFN